jgi:type II secretory pathway pseudopilin PulG
MNRYRCKCPNQPGLRRVSDGFSLLEMVLATALLAGTLAPALAVMRDALALSRETTIRSLLANYVAQKLEEHSALAIGAWTSGSATGTFSAEGHPEIAYNVTRSDSPAEGGITGSLMHVWVTVFEDLDADLNPGSGEIQVSMRTKIAKLATYENDEQ